MTKISALPADTAPTSNDYIPALDSDTSTTKKVPLSALTPMDNPYKFNAWRSTTQTPNGSVIIFNSELFDTSNNYDTTNGRFTAPIAGFYQINSSVTFQVTAAPQDPQIQLKKNGSTVVAHAHFVNMYNGSSNGSVQISILLQLAAGDYLQVTGANLVVAFSDSSYTNFSGFLVSRT